MTTINDWLNGKIPIIILENFTLNDKDLQIALAHHSNPEVRKLLARRDIYDETRTILQSDPNSEVRETLLEGVNQSKEWEIFRKSISSTSEILHNFSKITQPDSAYL